MDREEAAKELMAMLEEAQEGPYYSEEEVRAHLLENPDKHLRSSLPLYLHLWSALLRHRKMFRW